MFVVMPNHVHGIVAIMDMVGAGNFRPIQPSPNSAVGAVGKGGKFPALTPPLRNAGPPDDPVRAGNFPPPPLGEIPRRPSVAIMVPNSLGHIMQMFKAAPRSTNRGHGRPCAMG